MTAQSATLVDHLLVTPNLLLLRSVQSLGLSDHCCQIMEVDTPVIQPLNYTLSVRSFRSCPWDEVRECLRSAPWQVMDMYDSVDDMWSFFQGILRNGSCHRPAPWVSSSLLEAIRKKQQAKRKAELSGDSNDLMKYKQLKNYLKICTRQAKLSYIQQLISEARRAPHLSGQLWAGVNSVLGRHQRKQASVDTSLSLDSVNAFFRSIVVTDDHQPASTFCWG